MSTSAQAPSQKRPWLAAFLQFGCLFAGLGYAYLGRWGSFGKAIGLWLVLQAANAAFATLEYKGAAMVISPTLFIFQVLTAYDAWKLARGDERVPLVSWL